MHILYICQYFPPEMGAPAARAYEFSRRWVRAGHRVSVVCGIPNHPTGEVYPGYRKQWRRHENIEGIDVYRTWVYVTANAGTARRSLNYLSFGVTSVLSSMAVHDADVVIASTPQFFAGLAGTLVRRMKRVPLLLEVRDLWPDSLEAVEAGAGGATMSVLRSVERFMYHDAQHIVIVSPAFRGHIEGKGTAGEKISVVPNGVSTGLFRPPEEQGLPRSGGNEDLTEAPVTVLPEELRGKFVAAYVGTHGMAHRLETVVDAARLLLDDSEIHILFVGEGARKEAVKASAGGLPNVTFLDRMPRERVAVLLREVQAGIVVLRRTPLFRTVIPSKMFEMMGAGVPLVLGVGGQAREILDEAQGGIAIEPENADDLAAALRKLKNDRALREWCGKNASLHVRKKYDLDILAQEYLQVITRHCSDR